jgi:hypothetical protein
VFSNAAAGIAARSIRYVFPFASSSFLPKSQERVHRLDKAKLRLASESRKHKFADLSTDAMNRRGQVGGWQSGNRIVRWPSNLIRRAASKMSIWISSAPAGATGFSDLSVPTGATAGR